MADGRPPWMDMSPEELAARWARINVLLGAFREQLRAEGFGRRDPAETGVPRLDPALDVRYPLSAGGREGFTPDAPTYYEARLEGPFR